MAMERWRKEMRMNNVDIISGLPEPLLHHILSFMDMKDVVHTSLLSKRWRHLWRSLRVLTFNEDNWRRPPNYNLKKGKFKYFVDTVLLLREGSDIHSFRLFYYDAYDYDSMRIDRWVTYAIRRRVHLLELIGVQLFDLTKVYAPPSLFKLCGQVNTLILYRIWFPPKNPDLVLDLSLVETLSITACDHRETSLFTISAPKLKHLKLEHEIKGYNNRSALKICAPKLISLNCKGFMYEDYIFESPSPLTTAQIDTRLHWLDETTPPTAVFMRCMSNILKQLTHAESLIISVYGFQACSGFPNFLDGVLIRCEMLKHLKLWGWFDCFDSDSVAKLLQSFPNVETVVLQKIMIKLDSEEEEEEEGIDFGEELLFETKFHAPKSLEIHNFEGTENELKFLEVLLKNAVVLESITVMSNVTSSDKEKEMVSFSKKIQSLLRASPCITTLLDLKGKW